MENVLLVIHLFLALAIIGLVLLQRSEGGGLGIGGGGGGGGLGGFASAKSTANALTKATSICAAAFFCTSLLLGILAGQNSEPVGLMDSLEEQPASIEVPKEPSPEDAPDVPIAN